MHFLIIARDGTDAQALERRMAAREAHIAVFREGLEAGQNLVGGALLSEEGAMQGSMLVVEFDDRETLNEWLKTDPYVTGDVWQDIEVIPFKLAGMVGKAA
ncbi:MAG: hypothetical protein KDJ75_01350 [Alphaproteobacteria bacterium]|nr:hypothetical protein [Alphaproteobacteria bacterium]